MSYRSFSRPDSTGWTASSWLAWMVEQDLLMDVRGDIPEGVCDTCYGGTAKTREGLSTLTPNGAGGFTFTTERTRWPRCWACQNISGLAGVLPISYSIDRRLESALWRAKNEPTMRWLNVPLAALLNLFLQIHLECIEARWGAVDYITTIPSHSNTREGWDHMDFLVQRVRPWPAEDRWHTLLRKTGSSNAASRRGSPTADLFSLDPSSPDLDGARVLLIDDTYTTGATLRSAAMALEAAGADAPVVVTIGRQVRADDFGSHIISDANARRPRFDIEQCAIHTLL